jgi:hypothetical protein
VRVEARPGLQVRGGRIGAHEVGFNQPLRASVEPHVEPRGPRAVVRFGNGQQEWLGRSVERRVEAEGASPFQRCPRRLALQLFRTRDPAIEHFDRIDDIFLNGDVLRKLQEPVAGLRMNLDVGHQIVFTAPGLQRAHQRVQLIELRADRFAILRGQFVPRRLLLSKHR